MYESDAAQMKRQAMEAAELREEEARMDRINAGECGKVCLDGDGEKDEGDEGEDMYENTDEGEANEDHGN